MNRIERFNIEMSNSAARCWTTSLNGEEESVQVGSPEFPDVKSDINVTPLVDVVLVLLIIFMVCYADAAKGSERDAPVNNYPDKNP